MRLAGPPLPSHPKGSSLLFSLPSARCALRCFSVRTHSSHSLFVTLLAVCNPTLGFPGPVSGSPLPRLENTLTLLCSSDRMGKDGRKTTQHNENQARERQVDLRGSNPLLQPQSEGSPRRRGHQRRAEMTISCFRSGSLKAELETRILTKMTFLGCSQLNIQRQWGEQDRAGEGGWSPAGSQAKSLPQ